jgi:hypothetical protein
LHPAPEQAVAKTEHARVVALVERLEFGFHVPSGTALTRA